MGVEDPGTCVRTKSLPHCRRGVYVLGRGKRTSTWGPTKVKGDGPNGLSEQRQQQTPSPK